jgi:hypothetical protein
LKLRPSVPSAQDRSTCNSWIKLYPSIETRFLMCFHDFACSYSVYSTPFSHFSHSHILRTEVWRLNISSVISQRNFWTVTLIMPPHCILWKENTGQTWRKCFGTVYCGAFPPWWLNLASCVADIQEFYELTLLDDTKSTQQKTAETIRIANKWEASDGPITPTYGNNDVSHMTYQLGRGSTLTFEEEIHLKCYQISNHFTNAKPREILFKVHTDFVNVNVGCEVLTPVVMKIPSFWDIIPRSPLKVNWHFVVRGPLHLQGRKINQLLPVSCLAYSSTPTLEATCFFETSVGFHRTTRRYIPEYRTLSINVLGTYYIFVHSNFWRSIWLKEHLKVFAYFYVVFFWLTYFLSVSM